MYILYDNYGVCGIARNKSEWTTKNEMIYRYHFVIDILCTCVNFNCFINWALLCTLSCTRELKVSSNLFNKLLMSRFPLCIMCVKVCLLLRLFCFKSGRSLDGWVVICMYHLTVPPNTKVCVCVCMLVHMCTWMSCIYSRWKFRWDFGYPHLHLWNMKKPPAGY